MAEVSNYRALVDSFVSDVTLIVDNCRVDKRKFGTEYAVEFVRVKVENAVEGITDRYERENKAGDAADDAVRELLGSVIEGTDFTAMLFCQFLGAGTDAWREVGKHYLADVEEGL